MLLERAGDVDAGKVVREALEAFQREYAETHPSVSLWGNMAVCACVEWWRCRVQSAER